MANKFQGIEPEEPGTDLIKPSQMGMDGGFRGDVSPRSIQPGETPVLDDIRFERTAIRKDFGWQAIGVAAGFPVRGLVEHKFISEGLEFARLVRIFKDATDFAIIEVWDGNNWVFVDTSDPITINDVYLSLVTAQGALYMAEGRQILCWLEDLADVTNENDFPANLNTLFNQGEKVTLVVTPAFPSGILQYSVGYNVAFNREVDTNDPDVVVIQFKHEGSPLGTVVHEATRFDSFPLSTGNQAFTFNATVVDLDEVEMEIIQIRSGNVVAQDDVTGLVSAGFVPLDPPGPSHVTDKSLVVPARDDRYTWSNFVVGFDDEPCTVTIEYWVDFDDGNGFVVIATVVWTRPGNISAGPIDFIIPGLIGPNIKFGMRQIGATGVNCGATFIDFGRVRWDAIVTDIQVHGNNKAVSSDETAGITYTSSGAAQSTFEPIVPGPGARYLVHFARRLIALQDLGDRQVFSFTRDGLLTEFTGEGSGELFLVDTRSDGIDALQGGAVLNSNFLAVFRQRSIMRAFESGNIEQAIGVVTWIENLGTNYPFSIRNVLGGVMFLGHDQMVYFLNEQGPRAVGLPIHQEIIEDLTGDLSLVDSGWDPTFGEYYLGIPVAAATEITKVWVFDVDRYLKTQETIWRRKPMNIQRFATGGISEVL